MANSQDIAGFYSYIVQSVVQDVRQDFINMGVDEQVLVDLQTIWEQKLLAAKIFNPADYPLSQPTVPGGFGGYARETFDFSQINPGTVGQGRIYQNQPVRIPPLGQNYSQQLPQGFNPQQGMNRPPQAGPNQGNNDNEPRLPQYDGGDDVNDESGAEIAKTGKDKELDLDVKNNLSEDSGNDEKKDDKDELGSDLDDDDEISEDDDGINTDLVLCLYEKVNRTRNKWKCNFKSGIAKLNGRDYAFNRLTSDFEW